MVKKIFETRFENGSLIDAIENRILTPTGTVTLKRTDKGTAALFDGGISSSAARLESDFQITTIPFTVVVNFKFVKDFSVGYIISQTMTNNPGRFIIDIQSDDKLEYFLGGDSFKTDTLVNNKWYQAIFTRDGDGVCRFYLDNKYLGTYTNNNAIPLNNLFQIGGSSVVINRVMFGYINKVIVYDGVISTVQIEKHYQEFLQSQITEKPVRGFELVKPTDLSYLKDTGLVAAYNMIPNGNTLVDISGNGNNGTINGAISTKDGLKFDGVDDYINCGKNVLTNVNKTQATWAFRINRKAEVSAASIISKYESVDDKRSWNIRELPSGVIGCTFSSNGTLFNSITSGNDLLENNKDLNIVMTFNAGQVNFYKNGVLHSTATSTQTSLYANTTADAIIGYYTAYYNGEISDIRIYDRVLTKQEIKDYHNSFIKPVTLEDWSGSAVGDTI